MKIITLKTILFFSLTNFYFAQDYDFGDSKKNILKFDPIRLFCKQKRKGYTGELEVIKEFNLSYERLLSRRISIETELGVTKFIPIGMFSSGIGGYDSAGSSGYGDNASYLPISTSTRNGLLFSLAGRYYFKDEMNGFYISPKVKYRNLNDIITAKHADFYLADPEKNETRNEIMLTSNFGFQKIISTNFVLDFYVGFGGKASSYNLYRGTAVYNNQFKIVDFIWTHKIEKDQIGYICFGVKIGYNFKFY